MPTEAELHDMMRDPRYWRDRDPEFIKRVTAGFRELFLLDEPASVPDPEDPRDIIVRALDPALRGGIAQDRAVKICKLLRAAGWLYRPTSERAADAAELAALHAVAEAARKLRKLARTDTVEIAVREKLLLSLSNGRKMCGVSAPDLVALDEAFATLDRTRSAEHG